VTAAGPVVFPCERFGRRLGLDRLHCAFNGYWPEKGAFNPTGTFKDLEALPTLQMLVEQGKGRLVLASAGNTARAFAHAARSFDVEVYIVVPEAMLNRMWLPAGERASGTVRLAAVKGSSDYSEAIRLSEQIAARYGIDSEGGARNVARRDGLGTVMLEAARVLGRLPDHYFQAVGSGTGGIAVYEAALRLAGDGFRGDGPLPRLHLSQNAPFLPLFRAWQGETWEPDPQIDRNLFASVLANRNPPFAVRGGVADALRASRGTMYAISNQEAEAAGREFSELEEIDLEPAAAVAVASLTQAVAGGEVRRDELVLLNATGGGLDLIRRDFSCRVLEPDLRFDASTLSAFEDIL
jgi:cysteate synthase